MGNNRNADQTHNRQQYGPHRVAGFSPIPAMSMVSHAVGARFISLIGGSMLSFYDWYADLPVASPQVFGMGSVAGVLLLLGLAILIARHQLVGPVFSATTRNDKAMYLVLSVVILLGLWTTVRVNVADGGYDHRETVSPWFRSLFILQPDPELRVGVPLGLQLHGECVGIVRDLAVHPAHPRLQRGGGPARLPNPPVRGVPQP